LVCYLVDEARGKREVAETGNICKVTDKDDGVRRFGLVGKCLRRFVKRRKGVVLVACGNGTSKEEEGRKEGRTSTEPFAKDRVGQFRLLPFCIPKVVTKNRNATKVLICCA